MEAISIAIFAFASVIVLPALVLLCADSKDSVDDEPKLRSSKKKESRSNVKPVSFKSSSSTKRQSKHDNGTGDTVIANGSAVGTHIEATPSKDSLAHAYEDPEALTNPPKHVNEVLTNGASISPKASVVNETSPSSSQRSSRASGGQPRVVSMDRALPEIPGQSVRLSVPCERSPSTKRALPDIPSTTVSTSVASGSTAEEEGASHYDQLERDLPPHQIKSKSSESSSIKVKMRFAIDEEEDSGSSSLIEPDEVTRSSVFVSTNPNEVYSSVADPPQPTSSSEQASGANLKPEQVTKAKVKTQYTKVKKDSASAELRVSGSEKRSTVEQTEPVYQDPPPVPAKNYDVQDELAAGESAASAVDPAELAGAVEEGAVALVIDNNAQDSGSGYYAVTDNGPAPDIVISPAYHNVPESYDILSARESITSVRARQEAAADEDYYESVDNKGEEAVVAPKVAPKVEEDAGGTELYAEIDQEAAPAIAAGTARPVINKQSNLAREELYAEIDSPPPSSYKLSVTKGASTSLHTSHTSDPGYEKVDFAGSKGEQTDSAGYAIVKESAGAAAAAPAANDEEEDYAECEPAASNGVEQLAPAAINEQLSRHASDVSDYATVSYNSAETPAAGQNNELQSPPTNEGRPFQRYIRREHTYQEIDEVRVEKNPPDKKS